MTALIPPPLKASERKEQSPEPLDSDQVRELTPKERMLYNLAQPQTQLIYRKRKQSVEPVIGQIKGSPGNSRFRRFVRRTMSKCRQDWMLLCCVHNLSKYIKARAA